MEGQVAIQEIQEKDLELVITTKKLGSLTTNAKDIKAMVESVLPNYSIENYNESNIDQAKKDKAMLNKAGKALNSKRIEIEREFMKPFSEFKETITETVKLISGCSSQIDSVVKDSEERAKDEKRSHIQSYWDSKQFDLVPLSKVFDDSWLNKTTKLKNVESAIDEKIESIKDDLLTLEALEDDVDLLKPIYLENLDINSTIKYAKTLNENRAKAKQDADNRASELPDIEDVEVHEGGDINQIEVRHIEPKTQSMDDNEILERTMRVRATKEKIIALSDFMNANGIEFEKI